MRVVRICCASAGTVVVALLGLAAVLLGVGQHLEDACVTEPPASFAPESTVLRGPVPQGPVTFRCEADGGGDYVFTDAVPLVWTVAVGVAVLVSVVVLWWWAVRRPAHERQPAPA